jgi:biotin carboxyl carrier protein
MNRGNPLGLRSYQIALDDAAPVTVEVLANADTTWVHTADFSLGVQTRVPRRISGSSKSAAAETVISSPIPGKVAALHAVQGAAVQEGELLLVLDSMKMEHPFRASRSGTLVSVDVRQGELIQAGAVLVVIA